MGTEHTHTGNTSTDKGTHSHTPTITFCSPEYCQKFISGGTRTEEKSEGGDRRAVDRLRQRQVCGSLMEARTDGLSWKWDAIEHPWDVYAAVWVWRSGRASCVVVGCLFFVISPMQVFHPFRESSFSNIRACRGVVHPLSLLPLRRRHGGPVEGREERGMWRRVGPRAGESVLGSGEVGVRWDVSPEDRKGTRTVY
jgi:hypothetical protein